MSDTADTAGVASILAKERAAQNQIQLVKDEKNAKWMDLSSVKWEENKPALTAMILTEPPYNYSMPVALAVVMTCQVEGANPFTNDVYVIQGKISFSVQFKIKKARSMGMQVGIPKYEMVTRPYPKGATKVQGFDEDYGCKCTLPIGGDQQVQTAWISTSYMAKSEVWRTKTEHMLKVRALDYCLRFTGIGISEPVEADDGEPTKVVEAKVVAPTQIPLVPDLDDIAAMRAGSK